jgi:MFS family permease
VGPDVAVLRRSREFRLLFLSQTLSFAGSMITYVAMPYQAYRLTGSSLVVGLLGVTELVPMIAAALPGGVLADAVDRRRLILITEAAPIPGMVLLVINAAAWHQLWLLFVLAGVSAGLTGVQRPSQEALTPLLLRRDELTAAAALTGLFGNVAERAGPLAGGGIIALARLPAAYATDGATCLAGLAAAALMRPAARWSA